MVAHSEDTHWNMNDHRPVPANQEHPRTYDVTVNLIEFDDLKKGETMVVIVSVMEEDSGTVWNWLDFSKDVAGRIPDNETATAIGGIADTLKKFLPNIKDTDDYIGSFRIDLSYQESDGYTIAKWSAAERSKYLGQSSGPRSNGFRFKGDGSNYYGWGEIFLRND